MIDETLKHECENKRHMDKFLGVDVEQYKGQWWLTFRERGERPLLMEWCPWCGERLGVSDG